MEAAELIVVVRAQGIDKTKADMEGLAGAVDLTTMSLNLLDEGVQARLNSMRETQKVLSTMAAAEKLLATETKAAEEQIRAERQLTWTIAKTLHDQDVFATQQAEAEKLAATKAAEEQARAERQLTWTVAKTLYDQGVFATQKAEAEKLAAIEVAEAEARAARELTWSALKLRMEMEAAATKQLEAEKLALMERTQAEALVMNRQITASRNQMWATEMANFKRSEAAQERLAAHPFAVRAGKLFGQIDSGADVQQQVKQMEAFRTKAFDFLVFFGTAKAVQAIIVSQIIEPLKRAVQAAIEFERQWAIVTRTVTGSAEEMAKVRSGLQGLMATRPLDPQQITEAARALGELGVAAKEIVPATDYVTRFSVASGIATEQAATLLGQILATSGIARPTADDIGKLASSALALGTSFAIGNEGVLTMMVRVSALIPTFHLSEQAALGLSTAMGSLGIKAERGTTALQLLLSIASTAGPEKLDRFANIIGKTAAETQNLIRTDPGKFIELFAAGLRSLSDEGENINITLEGLGIKTVRARQVFGQMAGGTLTVSAAMEKANESFGTMNDLMEQSEKQFGTADSSLKTLSNSMWVLAGSMTEGVLTPLTNVTNGLSQLAAAAAEVPGPSFWEMIFSSPFSTSGFSGRDFAAAVEIAKKINAERERANTAGLFGQSPLVERVRTDAQKAGDVVTDALNKALENLDEPAPPFASLRRQAEAAAREDDANRAKEKKEMTELENFVDQHYQRSLTAQEKYNQDRATLDKAYAAGKVKDKATYDRLLGQLDKELADNQEKAAKKANEMTDAERDALQLIKEARGPYEVFDDTLKAINEAKKHGLTIQQEQNALNEAYLVLLKGINTEAGTSEAKYEAQVAAQKKLNDEMDRYAASLNPVVDLERDIAKVRAAHAARPGTVTDEIMNEEIARLNRNVKLPEEYEKQMRIVKGIVERGMNAVSDTMTNALFEGTVKGKEIMRSFAKDITNILLEEIVFKPLSEKIIDQFKDFQIADYFGKIKAGMPGGGGNTDVGQAAEKTTKSFEELGKGAIDLFADLTQGIGAFLTGLFFGQKGGGWSIEGFFKSLGFGAAEGAVGYLIKQANATPKVPDTSHEVPVSSVDGQSQYDPLPGAGYQYRVGSRSQMMDYSTASTSTSYRGQAPPVNITVTSLDPRTATDVIMANMPVIERGMQRAVDRGSAYAKAHGRRR